MAKFKVAGAAKKAARTTISAGQRMRNTARSAKDKAVKLGSKDQRNPNNQAVDQVTNSAESLAQYGARMTVGAVWRIHKKSESVTSDFLKKTVKGRIDEVTPPRQSPAGRQPPAAQNAAPTSAKPPPKATAKRAPQGAKTPQTAPRTVQRGVRQSRQSAEKVTRTVKATNKGIKTIKKQLSPTKQVAKKTAQATKKTAQIAKKTVHTAHITAQVTQRTMQTSAHAAQKVAQIAQVAAKTAVQAVKTAAKATTAAIKAIIAAGKALVLALTAGGWIAAVVVILIGAVAFIIVSPFGIFFSGADTQAEMSLPKLIADLNTAYTDKIDEYKEMEHDYLELDIARAPWPEVLAIYAISTNTDIENPLEVVTLDEEKKDVLTNLYWRMNILTARTVEEVEIETGWGENEDGEMEEVEVSVTKIRLYITGTILTAYDMAALLDFTEEQYAMLDEMTKPEMAQMWQLVLYGNRGIVAVALSQAGNVGGQKYWGWYGFDERVEWCACFVSWCANECGFLDSGLMPMFSSCGEGINWYKAAQRWQETDCLPVAGDLIFFDWERDGITDHVGIVTAVDKDYVYTIEGNTGDTCAERSYSRSYAAIVGYGTQQ